MAHLIYSKELEKPTKPSIPRFVFMGRRHAFPGERHVTELNHFRLVHEFVSKCKQKEERLKKKFYRVRLVRSPIMTNVQWGYMKTETRESGLIPHLVQAYDLLHQVSQLEKVRW